VPWQEALRRAIAFWLFLRPGRRPPPAISHGLSRGARVTTIAPDRESLIGVGHQAVRRERFAGRGNTLAQHRPKPVHILGV